MWKATALRFPQSSASESDFTDSLQILISTPLEWLVSSVPTHQDPLLSDILDLLPQLTQSLVSICFSTEATVSVLNLP